MRVAGRLDYSEDGPMHRPELIPAIDALVEELVDIDRQAAELRNTINLLCRRAGLEQRYAEIDSSAHAAAATSIKPDTFYGKRMQTAAREYLEMRKRAESGPAKPREIFDALTMGGFRFDTKDETNSLVSLRAMLRKNSGTFHKLPNGEYGLKAWYPNAKPSKEESDGREISPSKTKPARKRIRKRPVKPKKAKGAAVSKKTNPFIAPFIISATGDGSDWTTERLKQEAIARETPGVDDSTKLTAFHSALLGLKSRGLVRLVSKGLWCAVNTDTETVAEDVAEVA